jgi:flavorubredoxin
MTQTSSTRPSHSEIDSIIQAHPPRRAPQAPTVYVPPTPVGPDTYLIHSVQEALGAPLSVYLNSLLITGDEPVIVDTGTVANRRQWLDDVFGLVDPKDLRYIFLSHDDHDHTGNLVEALALAPNAKLVCTWAMVERIANAFDLPLERCLWLNDGESFDAGSHRLLAVRPPNFDSPTTRGLLDQSTGIYWAVDSFAAPCPGGPVASVEDLNMDFWRDGMAMFIHNAVSAWLRMVDVDKYTANVDRIQAMGITTIAAAHSPLITGNSVAKAFDLARELPLIPPPPVPDQAALNAILSGAGA